jgi:hypothetical protein
MFGRSGHSHVCGIYYVTSRFGGSRKIYLPQVDVSAHATILATTSRTVLTQTFANTSTEEGIREARYVFPLYDGVSVVGFTCLVGDRTIVGEVKEKDRARADFKEAVSRGETAGLLEQLPSASDIFTTTVGNIPPGAKVVVQITYLGELKQDMEVDGVRFTIPNIICPRYRDYPIELQSNTAVDSIGGGVSITVDADMADGSFIQKMLSPTHPISMSMGTVSSAPDAEPIMTRASATLSLGTASLDTDFVLQIIAKNTGVPKAVVENHPTVTNHRALMATLVPKFTLPAEKPEIVFVIDRSGSMGGSRINLARQAMLVFLKSLPVGVKFNICSFGWSHSFLWPKSVTYNQRNLEEAVHHAGTLEANYGGTEMLRPVEATIQQRYNDMSLEVILLTDGGISNQQDLFSYLNSETAEAKKPIRVFTLGIGNGVSHSLIEGVARAGNGFSQAVGEGEKMDSKVVRMLKGALSPHITDYTLEVKYSAPATNPEDGDDFEIVEKVVDSLKVNLGPEEMEKTTEVVSGHSSFASQAHADLTQKKPISLFNPFADPDEEDVQASDETGESRYAHLAAVPIPKIIQAPQRIPSLFAFNRTTVYLLLGPEAPRGTPKSVILRGSSAHGPLELEIPVQVLATPGSTIHQLAAKKAVSELEQDRGWLSEARDEHGKLLKAKFEGRFDEMVEREAVRLGVQFQVGGKWCSFVAVEKNPGVREDESWEFLEDAPGESSNIQMQQSQWSAQSPAFGHPPSPLSAAVYVPGGESFGPGVGLTPIGTRGGVRGGGRGGGNPFSGGRGGGMPSGGTRGGRRGGGDVNPFPRTTQESFNGSTNFASKPAFGRVSAASFRVSDGSVSDDSDDSTGVTQGGAKHLASILTVPSQKVKNSALKSAPSPGGLFGSNHNVRVSSASAASQLGGLFGSSRTETTSQSPAAQSYGLFGVQSSSAAPRLNRLFGSPNTTASSNLFGGQMPSVLPQATGFFCSSPNTASGNAPSPLPSGGLFGASAAPTSSASSAFGAASTASSTNPFRSASRAPTNSLFGSAPAARSFAAPTPSFSFGIPPAPAPAPPPPTSPLHAILTHQTFSGAFTFSEALLRSLSIAVKDFEEKAAADGIEDRDVFATAVVVAYLEEKMSDEKDSWELVVDKAREWMEEKCRGVEGMKKIMAAARRLVV